MSALPVDPVISHQSTEYTAHSLLFLSFETVPNCRCHSK